jgi:hypothetical protein
MVGDPAFPIRTGGRNAEKHLLLFDDRRAEQLGKDTPDYIQAMWFVGV